MVITTLIKRGTARLIGEMAELVGEGHHTSFRKFCDHPSAQSIHDAITEMPGELWSKICVAGAKTVVRHIVQYPHMEDSMTSQTKIARRLALSSAYWLRRLKKEYPEELTLRRYVSNMEEMGFTTYREAFEVLAGELIKILLSKQETCVNCRFNERHDRSCPNCGQSQCAVHCDCTTGGERRRGYRQKRRTDKAR